MVPDSLPCTNPRSPDARIFHFLPITSTTTFHANLSRGTAGPRADVVAGSDNTGQIAQAKIAHGPVVTGRLSIEIASPRPAEAP
jgi:hypothetical protein